MAQITGTITFSSPGLVYPEHLNLSLCYYDTKGLRKYAKFNSSKVYKDFSYIIELDERDLDPNINHFIELKYAGLSVRTEPFDVKKILDSKYDISFFNLKYYMELTGTVQTTRGENLERITVTVLRHELLTTSTAGSASTDANGYFQFLYNFMLKDLEKFIDPSIYPEFVGNNAFDIQIEASDPDLQFPNTYSDIFYDAKDSVHVDIIVGEENVSGKPEFVKKEERFLAIDEFEELSLSDLERATQKTEYVSKKLKLSNDEASHFIKAKYYKTKFSCDEQIMFALLKDKTERSYKDILFTPIEQLKEEVVSANGRNIINFVEEKGVTIDNEIARLRESLITEFLNESEVDTKLNLIQGSGSLNRTLLVEAFIDWKNSPEEQNEGKGLNFYLLENNIIDNDQFKKAEVYDNVAKLSNNNIGLSVAVLSDASLNWTSIDDIIAAQDDLETLINGYVNSSAIEIPEEFSDVTSYVNNIKKQMVIQYPSQFLKNEIIKPDATLFADTNISTFLSLNPDFQFGKNHGFATIADPNTILDGLNEAQINDLKVELQEAEQIFKLTPYANKSVLAGAMKTSGLTSPSKIARLSRNSFKEQMLASLPAGNEVNESELDEIYTTSIYVSNATTLNMIAVSFGRPQTNFPVVPSYNFTSQETTAGFPSIYELFGSQDYFEYPECRTLFSQAAYLTDLLKFLHDSNGKTNNLFSRRPDLQHILLNCNNTNTVLPHIDLINEILEKEVLNQHNSATTEMNKLQTTWAPEELAAYPENLAITKNAYNYLKEGVAPWSLPFNLPLEEFRLYLKTLGLSREDILKNFSPSDNQNVLNEILFESIGLSTQEVALITTPITQAEELEEVYPGISTVINGSNYIETGNVKKLTLCSDLTYDKINELLESYFINPVNNDNVRFFTYTIPGYNDAINNYNEDHSDNPIVPGTLETTFILNGTASNPTPGIDFYDRLHRFERLRRKLDVEVFELDLIFNYFNINSLNENDIIKIAYFRKVKSLLNLKIEETLLLFGDFITGKSYTNYVNLYDFIFLKKTENYQFKENFEYLIGYVENPSNPENFTLENIQTILPYISGVKITEQQYLSIINYEWGTPLPTPSLAVLSTIIRTVLLCKSLNISVDEFYFLKNNFEPEINNPKEMLEFIEMTTKLKDYGFSIPDLAYVLKNLDIEGNKYFKTETTIKEELEELREIIKPVEKKQYRKHVIENSEKIFSMIIDQALDLVFEDFEDESLAGSFIATHSDLFHNFGSQYSTEPDTILEYFLYNKNNATNKLQAVLVGLGIESNLLSPTNRKITREMLKKIFTKIKTTLLLQTIELQPFYVKLDEIFDLSHNAVTNLTSIKDSNIDLNLKPYTHYNIKEINNSKNLEPSKHFEKKSVESGTIKNSIANISGYKYSTRIKKTSLLNVASSSIDIDYRQTLTVANFIEKNPTAFPDNTDFLTDTQLPNYNNIDLRYINYVTQMDLGVLEAKTLELKNLMSIFIDEDNIETAVTIVLNSPNDSLSDEKRKLFVEDYFSSFIIKSEALACLCNTELESYISNPCLRVDYVLNNLKQESRVDNIVKFFTEKFSCGEDIIAKLLFEYAGNNEDEPIIDHFCNEDFYNGIVIENQDVLNYSILYKTTLFINEFKLNTVMLNKIWEITQSENQLFNIINVFNIEESTEKQLLAYIRLSTAIGISHTYFADETDIFTFFTDNSELSSLSANAKSFISDISGCKTNDIENLSSVLPTDLYINWFERLLQCQYIIKHLGTNAQTIIDFNKLDQEIGFIQSETIRQLVKNKYSEDEWFSIAESLRNPLRIRQRNALRDYLIISSQSTSTKFESSSDLFYHFLIDPEMTTSVKTTRLTQAVLSVQLFIQRILMGLEQGLSFNEDEKKELVWRSNYRVWEANRKILFFPENWLDPELRQDKSPFFKELEEKLLQNDIDDSTVFEAYHEYINKLDEVANLEILAVHRVWDTNSESQTYHFVGKTQGSPSKYFYRRLDNFSSWTPWEEINNGIKADMVKLVYWRGNLYMFWLDIATVNKIDETKKNAYEDVKNLSYNETNPPQYTSIKMAWSVLKKGKWSKAIFSNDTYIEPFSDKSKQTQILITAYPYEEHPSSNIALTVCICGEDKDNKPVFGSRGGFYFNGQNLRFDYDVETFLDEHDRSHFNRSYKPNVFASGKNDSDLEIFNNSVKCSLEKNEGSNTFKHFVELCYFTADTGNEEYSSVMKKMSLFNSFNSVNRAFYVHFEDTALFVKDWRMAKNQYLSWFKPFVINDFIQNKTFLSIPYLKPSDPAQQEFDINDVRYEIINFYYPFARDIRSILNTTGFRCLFEKSFQESTKRKFLIKEEPDINFKDYYGPDDTIIPVYPQYEEIVFTPSDSAPVPVQDPYALYNWEMFFHIPIMIADNLSRNMKFEEAQKWYHLIFDPTIGNSDFHYIDSEGNSQTGSDEGAKKYWKIKPFRDIFSNMQEEEEENTTENSIPKTLMQFIYQINKKGYDTLITNWEDRPFDPHSIAAIRPIAYMKYVVVKYVENLISWGDMLFTKDSREDINNALLLYVLAADILGIKPQKLEGTLSEDKSFEELLLDLDGISNAYETITGILTVVANLNAPVSDSNDDLNSATRLYDVSYFGVPHNNKFQGYIDTVADRLFKIRNSMNIQGVVRELPLVAPPIDPGAVATALASGADLSSALSTLSAPMPLYRFNYMLQKAIEFTNDVKALGNTMLSVLEKKDAEEMALLRSSQEQIMLNAMTQIRKKAIDEAQENINSLIKSKENIFARRAYYKNKKPISKLEQKALSLHTVASDLRLFSSTLNAQASIAGAIPQIKISFPPAAEFGGLHAQAIMNALATVLSIKADMKQNEARHTDTMASYERRYEDWKFQTDQASGELLQIDKQIAGAKVRLAMAQKEYENHLLQIEQKKEDFEFMKNKFTNKQLYNWMKGEVSRLYQSAFQMAHKLALAAEKAYVFERQKEDYTSFITTAYWDNLREGLMAGELLYNDLRRLEMEYIETNSREIELSKDIPLSMIDPKALIELRTTGTCNFDIPEMLYDIDHPGHYMRRIKTVSISIPAVTGPYSGVTCKLSLLSNRFRKSTNAGDYNYQGINDLRFVHNIIGIQSIATSTGNNDTGMFEFNFKDERYLPFEGAGAIGSWSIELPTTIRKFDYESISDVILHIKYTARDAGGMLKEAAETNIASAINTLMDELGESGASIKTAYSMKSEFADEYYELINEQQHSCSLKIEKKHFPFLIADFLRRNSNKVIKVLSIQFYPSRELTGEETLPTLSCASGTINDATITFGDGETLTDDGLNIELSYGANTTPLNSDIYMLISYKI